jgi:diguanylate cyclase (GGDEF)-like protein
VGQRGLLLLDLDEFKLVNDGLGHAAGDQILVAVSKRLAGCVRSGDTVARLGGDEFVLLLEDPTSTSHAERTAQLLLAVLETPLRAGPLELPIRGSIGIALAQEDSTPESLIQDADIAMYAAKSSPSNSTMLFTEPMRHAATRRIEMRSELERAIGTDALRLLYQPIVDLQRNMPAGFEALLRWTHPERGAISPVEFIPLAEQSQLIGRIGRQVLFEATRQAALWNSDGRAISMSVNVSAIQFQEPGLVDEVREALSRSGLSPRNLTLELTETALMGDPQATETALIALRGMGVKLAIDDFGTGQCSLTYIKRFAPDSLKIDRAFVTEITDTGTQTLLAHGILRLADGLGIRCVAEGIETIEQATNLRAHGCAYGQGYLFSRPIDAIAAGSYLSAHRAAEVAMEFAGPTSSARR